MTNLYRYIDDNDLEVVECELPSKKLKGLYSDNVIYLKPNMTEIEKRCILAEELGHYETSAGNILDYSNLNNWKQEIKARNWAVDRLVTLDKLIDAYNQGVRDKYELAEYLSVTDDFLDYSITRLSQRFGVMVKCGDYVIYFKPNLMIFKGETEK